MLLLLLRVLSFVVALVYLPPAASAVTIDWTFIGDPGNAADTTGFGAVETAYNIGTYEVSNSQYAEFLNAVAASDPLALYNPNMDPSMASNVGGIVRSGSPGSYSYSAVAGREDLPVNHVSFYDALRFANWLHNGQGNGDTETGAYTLLGGTPIPLNGTTVTRNPGATIFLTSQDEWYKAAYFDAISTSYFDYSAGSDTQITCSAPTATANSANCNNVVGDLTPVGSYPFSASPYGTFDQGGNVAEWHDSTLGSGFRGFRGGAFRHDPSLLAASSSDNANAFDEVDDIGFRVASIPEPGTGALLMVGLVGLVRWRRQ